MYVHGKNSIMDGNYVNKHIDIDYLQRMKRFALSPFDFRKNRNNA